ncbi:hypothetical protein BN1708_003476 [Verticillium longisporum]|uniref:Uncharacterized protein n=1 Tax=Verticillium longisporum TaxID=100787 RepID=A0A0G4LIL7_VERLO|nr:hypothetical protein BN1708_003476 [Verticillium longisporum]
MRRKPMQGIIATLLNLYHVTSGGLDGDRFHPINPELRAPSQGATKCAIMSSCRPDMSRFSDLYKSRKKAGAIANCLLMKRARRSFYFPVVLVISISGHTCIQYVGTRALFQVTAKMSSESSKSRPSRAAAVSPLKVLTACPCQFL